MPGRYHDEYSQLGPDERNTQLRGVPPAAPEEEGVEVPYQMLDAGTLEELIKSFVLREGTDYGVVEASLNRKIEDIRRQLERKDLKIVVDLTTESASIVQVGKSLR